MASTKAASAIVANPSTIHRSSSPFSATPRLLSAIPKALSVSAVAHPSAASPTPTLATAAPSPLRRFLSDEPRKGADILVEALEHEGVTEVFAYPGGSSMEIHQALTRSSSITNHLRHEQGEVFAASDYTRSTGRPVVCIATSAPGTTNLVSSLVDALLDSVPMVAITGQVPRRMIGTDAFQETPIVEVTRFITKHNYLVLDIDDIPHIVKEAFFLASSCHPGPVLVDIPKDIQQQLSIPVWEPPLPSPGTSPASPSPPPTPARPDRLPCLRVPPSGPLCRQWLLELRRFVELTGIPVTTTLMGLGNYLSADELSSRMLGMQGTVLSPFRSSFSLLRRLFCTAFNHINISPTPLQRRD